MATKTRADLTLSYDDFEPSCNWKEEEGQKSLVVHLPEFKKEELKVYITNCGTIKIFGEHPVSETRSRFYKELRVPCDSNGNKIQAKFTDGHLYIVMPKNSTYVNEDVGAGDIVVKDATICYEFLSECSVSKLKRIAKVAMSAAVAVALVSVLGAHIICKCTSFNIAN
ncbi:hypothetical protein F0562_017547 [Nyssa sinensis]|uniref:SHSP domain-containing protein n=1 Tax=Nyssa sinensis TaxID=561372 RepID=A0A5J4ZJ07_9ASTE|nr:hypothetical protein F0562_017547 [Nyssa sinensis]